MSIRTFTELEQAARALPKVRVAVAGAADPEVLGGALRAVEAGVASAVLVGEPRELEGMLEARGLRGHAALTLVAATTEADAVARAVELCARGEASVLLKGMVSTGALLRGALSREAGLRDADALLSDVLVCPNVFRPGRPLFGVTDGGLNVAPDLEQKKRILANGLSVMRALGVAAPRVALLCASEKPDKSMPATLDARVLAELAQGGHFGPCVVEGPLALDVAVSAEAARHKGVSSEVAGLPDLLMVPSIEAGNLLGKSLYLSGRLSVAHVIAGARAPILINSRNDSAEDRYLSILLAMVVAAGRGAAALAAAPAPAFTPAGARRDSKSVVLALNPGATSTKVALYEGERELWREEVAQAAAPASRLLDQLPARAAALRELCARRDLRLEASSGVAAVVGRGGLLPPLAGGTYAIDDALLADLARAARGEHASNLGAPLAHELGRALGCPAFIVDPVSVDEVRDEARLTGWPGLEREILSHALNLRAVARRVAKLLSTPLAELRLIGVHLGTGISMAAFEGGRMVDIVNPRDEGPLSADRAGSLPSLGLAKLVVREAWTSADCERRLGREAGLAALCGTRDLREVRRRAAAGDAACSNALAAMSLGIVKFALGLMGALGERPDCFYLTGGMANDAELVAALKQPLSRFAQVVVVPGEDELAALAEGARRVVDGLEEARAYRVGR